MVIRLAVLLVIVTATHADHLHEINRINSVQNLWTAGLNEITDRGENYEKRLLGAKFSEPKEYRNDIEIVQNIPKSFDAREQWKECISVSSIKNQGYCGSCWAVSVASVASDRLCIATQGKVQLNISAEDLLTCCPKCLGPDSIGCDGGYTDEAWDHLKHAGLVTGGDYDSNEGCQPYSILPTGDEENIYTPPCYKKCTNAHYSRSYDDDKHHGKRPYKIPKKVDAIQSEILSNGPVQTGFIVYDDFKYYKTGIYIRTSHKKMGGHAVRILGWGVENGVDYWLVANSWGRSWGEDGTFRIRRGTDECKFETYVEAALIKK